MMSFCCSLFQLFNESVVLKSLQFRIGKLAIHPCAYDPKDRSARFKLGYGFEFAHVLFGCGCWVLIGLLIWRLMVVS